MFVGEFLSSLLHVKFACTSDEVLHGVDCCRGGSGGGGGGGGVVGLCKRETRRFSARSYSDAAHIYM